MTLLSDSFYDQVNKHCIAKFESEDTRQAMQGVDWEAEAQRCLRDVDNYLARITPSHLQKSGLVDVGVVDICNNEQDSSFEIDFLASNDFEQAFEHGCVMNSAAVDNDDFFRRTFDVDGTMAWAKLGDDYETVILAFYFVFVNITPKLVQMKGFQQLRTKSPCRFAFASFHDEARTELSSN